MGKYIHFYCPLLVSKDSSLVIDLDLTEQYLGETYCCNYDPLEICSNIEGFSNK